MIRYLRKASRRGAFFVCCLLFTASGAHADAAPAGATVLPASCEPDHIDETVRVVQIYDGDTVRLDDGRKLRLIGINTPEMGRDDRAPQPLALEARRALKVMLDKAQTIGLRHGSEARDRYHRELVHLFVDGHVNVQSQLLEQGLAFMIAIPPNLWGHDCYRASEQRAAERRRGIWALPYYQPVPVERLSLNMSGFHRISGQVDTVRTTARSIWLNMTGMSLRIARQDWPLFRQFDAGRLAKRRLVAQGWLYNYKGRLHMRIRHPDALRLIEQPPP